MKTLVPIDPAGFVSVVKPLLERNDPEGLLATLKAHWTKEQIVELLARGPCDARKVAALALSLVGCKECVPEIAKQLRDPDPVVNQMAEHALWSIWLRGGTPEANEQVGRGSQDLSVRRFEDAVWHFDQAIKLDPNFAEAYNQRGIAYFLQEEYAKSILDCQRATERMPCHFGAWAGMGHCHAHLGNLEEARACYTKAYEINPHLDCVRETLDELNRKLGK